MVVPAGHDRHGEVGRGDTDDRGVRQVAWLRRLGLPLARIRQVCDLDPETAAAQVAAHWAQVVADTAARGAGQLPR